MKYPKITPAEQAAVNDIRINQMLIRASIASTVIADSHKRGVLEDKLDALRESRDMWTDYANRIANPPTQTEKDPQDD